MKNKQPATKPNQTPPPKTQQTPLLAVVEELFAFAVEVRGENYCQTLRELLSDIIRKGNLEDGGVQEVRTFINDGEITWKFPRLTGEKLAWQRLQAWANQGSKGQGLLRWGRTLVSQGVYPGEVGKWD